MTAEEGQLLTHQILKGREEGARFCSWWGIIKAVMYISVSYICKITRDTLFLVKDKLIQEEICIILMLRLLTAEICS